MPFGRTSLQHGDSRWPKQFAVYEVTGSMFAIYRSGLFFITIDHGHRLVNCWIEWLAFTDKRCDGIRVKHVAESLMNQPETVDTASGQLIGVGPVLAMVDGRMTQTRLREGI